MARQHAVPVDLRQQHRGPLRPPRVPRCSTSPAGSSRRWPRSRRAGLDRAGHRRVRCDRRGPWGVPRPFPAGARAVAHLLRACSSSYPGAGHRPARLLVRVQVFDSVVSLGSARRAGGSPCSPTSAGSRRGAPSGWSSGPHRAGGAPPIASLDRQGRRGIIRPWPARSQRPQRTRRDGRRERPGPHALEPPRRHPQGVGAGSLPPDLDRAVGGQRDRDEAPGPDGRPAADPRPLRERPREPRRAGRPGRHLDPRRGDVSRPAPPRARRHDFEIDSRPSDALALAVRTGAGSSPARRSSSRRRSAATGARPDDDDERRSCPRGRRSNRRGEKIVDPRLDVFRDFVNSLDVDPDTGEGRTRSSDS